MHGVLTVKWRIEVERWEMGMGSGSAPIEMSFCMGSIRTSNNRRSFFLKDGRNRTREMVGLHMYDGNL